MNRSVLLGEVQPTAHGGWVKRLREVIYIASMKFPAALAGGQDACRTFKLLVASSRKLYVPLFGAQGGTFSDIHWLELGRGVGFFRRQPLAQEPECLHPLSLKQRLAALSLALSSPNSTLGS